jgi:competence protein ComEC
LFRTGIGSFCRLSLSNNCALTIDDAIGRDIPVVSSRRGHDVYGNKASQTTSSFRKNETPYISIRQRINSPKWCCHLRGVLCIIYSMRHAILSFFFAILLPFPALGYTAYVLDVKQGSSTFIRMSDKSGVLIDAGRSTAAPHIIKYLKDRGVDTIKLAIISHPDPEHFGGLEEIILSKKFVIGKVVKNQDRCSDRTYKTLMGTISRKKIPVILVKKDRKIGGIEIKNAGASGGDLDHRSLVVFYSDYKTIAIMGDADARAEKGLLSMKADILVLGNHGDSKASCKEFLDSLKPEMAFISADKRRFGTSTADLMQRLKNKKIPYFRTDKIGDIEVSVYDWALRVNGQEVIAR